MVNELAGKMLAKEKLLLRKEGNVLFNDALDTYKIIVKGKAIILVAYKRG